MHKKINTQSHIISSEKLIDIFNSLEDSQSSFTDRFFDFSKLGELENLFELFRNLLNENNSVKFYHLLVINLDKIILENRFNQFINYWISFFAEYKNQIPLKIGKLVNHYREVYISRDPSRIKSHNEILNIINITSGSHLIDPIYDVVIEKFLKEIYPLQNKKSKSSIQSSRYFLCLYLGILKGKITIKDIKDTLEDSYLSPQLKFVQFISNKYGFKIKENNSKYGISNSEIKIDLGINQIYPEKNRLEFLEIQQNDQFSIEQKIEYFVLSENWSAVIRILEDGHDELHVNGVSYLLISLLNLNKLGTVKKIWTQIFNSKKTINERRFLLIILKKLLIKNHEYKNARSIGKLLRE